MKRDQGKAIWAIALELYGTAQLEGIICSQIDAIYRSVPELNLPVGVSVEGLAELVRSLLEDVVSGDRPLLLGDRVMNRMHLQAVIQLRARLDRELLISLPVDSLTPGLRMLRAQADFGL